MDQSSTNVNLGQTYSMSTMILVRSNIASSIPNYRDILIEAKFAEKRVQRFAKKSNKWTINPQDLTGACAIASVALWDKLVNLLKIKEDCILNIGRRLDGYSCHAWIEIEDYVLDITARQFIGRNIFLEHIKEYSTTYLQSFHVETFYDNESSLDDVREYFKESGWTIGQSPFKGKRTKLRL